MPGAAIGVDQWRRHHDVSILIAAGGVGRYFGSQPRAKVSMMIMGIDTFLDMGRSATNVIGNSLATAVVAKWEGELAPEHALGPDDVVPPDMIPGELPGMQAGHA